MSSITQRSKSRAEVDCVPAAEAVWINEADVEMQMELAEPLLVDETNVTGASPGGDKNSTARKDDDGAHHEPFSVTNQQTQQCWGRFDYPQVEAACTDEHAIATARPDDRHVRLLFIRKVYTILSAQLLATFGVCAFMAMNETTKTLVMSSPNFYVLNMAVSLGSLLAMLVFKRKYPTNFILLSIFTFSMASSEFLYCPIMLHCYRCFIPLELTTILVINLVIHFISGWDSYRVLCRSWSQWFGSGSGGYYRQCFYHVDHFYAAVQVGLFLHGSWPWHVFVGHGVVGLFWYHFGFEDWLCLCTSRVHPFFWLHHL